MMSSGTPAEAPVWRRRARRALAPVYALFLLGVVLQAGMAGLAVFADAHYWAWHVRFIHAFDWLCVVAVILAVLGRLSRRTVAFAVGTLMLVLALYITAGLDTATGARYLAAVHPVFAILLFWAAARGGAHARAECAVG